MSDVATSARPGHSVLDLVRELERLPAAGFAEAAGQVVRAFRLDRASLDPYAFFSERHYTRNLIAINDLFEMLALCWWPGQRSSVHNHRDQHCWMLVGQGTLENQNYRVWDRDAARGTCKIVETSRCLITREQALAVDMDEPVHQIRTLDDAKEPALSVHIYSRPFDSCEVYCPDLGTFRDVPLTYWSRFGQVVARA
jgi:cysteine dioxygenase